MDLSYDVQAAQAGRLVRDIHCLVFWHRALELDFPVQDGYLPGHVDVVATHDVRHLHKHNVRGPHIMTHDACAHERAGSWAIATAALWCAGALLHAHVTGRGAHVVCRGRGDGGQLDAELLQLCVAHIPASRHAQDGAR